MGYLGNANIQAQIGAAGSQNPGNWTAVFQPQDIGISLPVFECYHINVDGGPPGSTALILIGIKKWDTVFPANDTSWDPNNPMPLYQGDTVSFLWNTGAGSAPDVTMYFREVAVLR